MFKCQSLSGNGKENFMGLLPSANPVDFTPNREKFMVLIISAWVIVGAIGIVLSWAFGDGIIGDAMGWVIGGAMGGLATGYALTLVKASVQSKQIMKEISRCCHKAATLRVCLLQNIKFYS